MIVTVYENGCSKTVVSEQNRFTITVFGCPLTILRIHDHHELRLSQTIRLSRKEEHANRTVYLLEKNEETARVDFYEKDSGFDTYRYCQCTEGFTIGGHVEDDIYIQDNGIPPHAITISFRENTIQTSCEELYCNEQQIHDASIDETSLYAILQLRFALCNEMVIFNGPDGIYCVNEKADSEALPLDHRQPVRFTSHLHKPLPEMTFHPSFPEYHEVTGQVEDNLLLSSLPSILMAAGALLSVVLMETQDAEITIMDYVPRLLMPLMMLVTAIILMPLQRVLRRHKTHRERKEMKRQYEQEVMMKTEEVLQKKEAVVTELETMYAMPAILLQDLMHGTMSCFNLYDGQFLSLRLGIAPLPFMVALDYGQKKTEEMDSRLYEKREGPFIMHMEKGMCYLFISQEETICEEITAKLALTHRPEDLLFIFLETEHMPVYCMMLPHAQRDGRTMIMSYGEYNKACMHMQTHIVIAFDTLPEDLNMDYAPVFVFSRRYLEDRRYAVVCDLDQGLFENRKEHMYCSFLKDHMDSCLKDIAMRMSLENVHAESENIPSYCFLHGLSSFKDLVVSDYWTQNKDMVKLSAVCGEDQESNRIIIDLDEKKDGPHGLIAGMTGSGKSEFLISLLLDIAVHNSPLAVSYFIFDFKGGGMLQALTKEGKPLPHIAGTLTNLDGYEMERVLYALKRTCKERQEQFVRMHEISGKNISHIDDYRSTYAQDMDLPVLPHLLIVADEFAEMKKEQPQFMDELISIARVGRSLGIHLLLATQKPAGIISEQIRANMSFTVCLKVKDAQDALEVINDKRPATLTKPGEFYLSSRNAIRYGKALYPGMKVKEDTVTCYDTSHRIICSSSMQETDLTEREVLMEKILETAGKLHVSAVPVYHKLPASIDTAVLRKHNAFALLDDYRHGREIYLHREAVSAIWGTDRREKEKCKRAILYCLYDQCEAEEEIYLIDETDTIYENCRNTSGLLLGDEVERLRALDERIQMGERHITIVIQDVETFLGAAEGNEQLLHKWLKNSGDNLHLILFLRISSDLRYRDMVSIGQRAVLKGTSVQEAAAILETSISSATANRTVLCKWDDYAVELLFPAITGSMEAALVSRLSQPKNYVLWKIPSRIPVERNEQGILLGYDKTNGSPVFVQQFPLVFSESAGMQERLKQIYQEDICVSDHVPVNDVPVLYAGYCSSFSLPYQLHVKEDISEGEGLYVCGHNVYRVKLCNDSG